MTVLDTDLRNHPNERRKNAHASMGAALTVNILRCPCGGILRGVKDSRGGEFHGIASIIRRRECEKCGERHTTVEMTADTLAGFEGDMKRRLAASLLTYLTA